MSGDPTNAALWADADVFLAATIATANPTSVATPFGLDWGLLGLLDGEAGFEEGRSEEKKDFFGWGGFLIRTSRRNFKMTKKFTCYEDNKFVRRLVYPGSTSTQIVVPRHLPIKLGFEQRDDDRTERLITRRHAVVDDIGTIKDSETELKQFEITVAIFPDSTGVLFDRQTTHPDDEDDE